MRNGGAGEDAVIFFLLWPPLSALLCSLLSELPKYKIVMVLEIALKHQDNIEKVKESRFAFFFGISQFYLAELRYIYLDI